MTDKQAHMPRLAELIDTVKRIETITRIDYGGEIRTAKELPAKYAGAVRSVSFSAASYYSHPDPTVIAAAEKLRAATEGAQRRRGEIERDGTLALLASELESLRAILPSLAAAASIEIGCEARSVLT